MIHEVKHFSMKINWCTLYQFWKETLKNVVQLFPRVTLSLTHKLI